MPRRGGAPVLRQRQRVADVAVRRRRWRRRRRRRRRGAIAMPVITRVSIQMRIQMRRVVGVTESLV